MNIKVERESITLISLLRLKGYKTNRMTANTMNGDLNRSVTVNSTPKRTIAINEIIIS
jgi:hypothetical protein